MARTPYMTIATMFSSDGGTIPYLVDVVAGEVVQLAAGDYDRLDAVLQPFADGTVSAVVSTGFAETASYDFVRYDSGGQVLSTTAMPALTEGVHPLGVDASGSTYVRVELSEYHNDLYKLTPDGQVEYLTGLDFNAEQMLLDGRLGGVDRFDYDVTDPVSSWDGVTAYPVIGADLLDNPHLGLNQTRGVYYQYSRDMLTRYSIQDGALGTVRPYDSLDTTTLAGAGFPLDTLPYHTSDRWFELQRVVWYPNTDEVLICRDFSGTELWRFDASTVGADRLLVGGVYGTGDELWAPVKAYYPGGDVVMLVMLGHDGAVQASYELPGAYSITGEMPTPTWDFSGVATPGNPVFTDYVLTDEVVPAESMEPNIGEPSGGSSDKSVFAVFEGDGGMQTPIVYNPTAPGDPFTAPNGDPIAIYTGTILDPFYGPRLLATDSAEFAVDPTAPPPSGVGDPTVMVMNEVGGILVMLFNGSYYTDSGTPLRTTSEGALVLTRGDFVTAGDGGVT